MARVAWGNLSVCWIRCICAVFALWHVAVFSFALFDTFSQIFIIVWRSGSPGQLYTFLPILLFIIQCSAFYYRIYCGYIYWSHKLAYCPILGTFSLFNFVKSAQRGRKPLVIRHNFLISLISFIGDTPWCTFYPYLWSSQSHSRKLINLYYNKRVSRLYHGKVDVM